MNPAAKPIQEPDNWEEEISDEELCFLAEVMPEQLAAKVAELEQDIPVVPEVPAIADRLRQRRAA